MVEDFVLEIARAVPMSTMTAWCIADISMNKLIILHGVRTHVVPDNAGQFVSKSLESLCAFPGTNRLRTKAFHTQKMEKRNNLVGRLSPVYSTMWQSTSGVGHLRQPFDVCLEHQFASLYELDSL